MFVWQTLADNGILLIKSFREETFRHFLVRFFSLLGLREAEFDPASPEGASRVMQPQVAPIN